MMVDHPRQQPHNSALSIQPEQQQHQQIIEQHQFIVPTTTTKTSVIDTTTITCNDQDFYDEEVSGENSDIIINVENDKSKIKQVG